MPIAKDPVERALASATLALSLSRGLFFAVSALYLTRGVGLSPATVGIGLTAAGAAGVVTSYLGGRVSDRVGADRVQTWALAAHGLSLLAYAVVRDVVAFVLVAACVSASRGLQSTAQSAMLARWYTGPERVVVRARLRAVMNVAIGVGTLLAGGALLLDTLSAYRITIVLVGVVTMLGAVPLLGLRRIPGLAERMQPYAPAHPDAPVDLALRDRTYLAATGLNALMAISFGLTSVGIPLWVADHTSAPTVVVSALLVVNTVYVALFQVRASRGTHDVVTAGRAVARAGALLLAGCVAFAVAAHLGPMAATAVLLLAALACSAAETLSEAGGWGLAFELADPERAGEYQGVSQMGYATAQMVAPAVITTVAIDHGTPGWVVLGLLFAGAGGATAALAGRAARRTPAARVPAAHEAPRG